MTTVLLPTSQGQRTFGILLFDGFTLMFDGLPIYLLMAGLGVLPGLALILYLKQAFGYQDFHAIKAACISGEWNRLGIFFAVTIGWMACFILVKLAVFVDLNNRDTKATTVLHESLNRAKHLFWPAVVIGAHVIVRVCGGLILLIVPGVLLGIRYSFSQLVLIVEGMTGPAALKRSREIVNPHIGKVAGNLFAMGVILAILNSVLKFIVLALGYLAFELKPLTLVLILEIPSFLIGVWGNAFVLLLYKDLAASDPQPSSIVV